MSLSTDVICRGPDVRFMTTNGMTSAKYVNWIISGSAENMFTAMSEDRTTEVTMSVPAMR